MRHRPYPVADAPIRIRMAVRDESMLNNVFEWFDDPQIKHSPDGTQFEVIVDAPERAVFWWALQYSWDGRVVILEPDSLKRKLYDAGASHGHSLCSRMMQHHIAHLLVELFTSEFHRRTYHPIANHTR